MALKRIWTIAFFWGVLAGGPALAQNAQLDQARADLQAGRDQIIREDLQLSEGELAAFWPLYEEYVATLAPLRDRKAELVAKFLEAYRAGDFSDEFAAVSPNYAIFE